MKKRKFRDHAKIQARANRICEYCLETIEEGTLYCVKFRVYDRELDEERGPDYKVVRVHCECEEASLAFNEKEWLEVYSGTFQRPETYEVDS